MTYVTTKHWLQILRELPSIGAILPGSSLRLLAGLDERAGRQALWRLGRAGLVTHLGQGWYTHGFAQPSLAEIAHVLVQPSYVSLETVLVQRGITTQPSAFLTSVTLEPTQRRATPLGEIHYRSLARHLFWGFQILRGPSQLPYLEAEPEKALLDLIYLSRRRGHGVWLDLDFERLDQARLNGYAERFPASVRATLAELKRTRVIDS